MAWIEQLQTAELFRDMQTDQLSEILQLAEEVGFCSGQRVCNRGEPAMRVFILCSGSVELSLPLQILGQERDIIVEVIEPGRIIGWSSLVKPYQRVLSARCQTDSRCLAIAREDLLALCERDSRIGYLLMQNLATLIADRLQRIQSVWTQQLVAAVQDRF